MNDCCFGMYIDQMDYLLIYVIPYFSKGWIL